MPDAPTVLLERAELTINPGMAEAFADAMATTGLPLLQGVDGVLSTRLGRGVERPDTFLLLVEWRSIADHDAFREAPVYPGFRALFGPFTARGQMEHFAMN